MDLRGSRLGVYLDRIQSLVQARAGEQERSRFAEDLHDRLGAQSTQIMLRDRNLGTDHGRITISNTESEQVSIAIPKDTTKTLIHVILEVTVGGIIALTRYRRAI